MHEERRKEKGFAWGSIQKFITTNDFHAKGIIWKLLVIKRRQNLEDTGNGMVDIQTDNARLPPPFSPRLALHAIAIALLSLIFTFRILALRRRPPLPLHFRLINILVPILRIHHNG